MNLGYKPSAVAIRLKYQDTSFSLYIVYSADISDTTYSLLAYIPSNNSNARSSAEPLGSSFAHWGTTSSFDITNRGFSLGGYLGEHYNQVHYIAYE